ncbi:hypothetical protein BD408DRAFT_412831 [Parasitella parasitica]|nr:hypothetical protein BD408DRAFT_412831 [Parasitella parasitica]
MSLFQPKSSIHLSTDQDEVSASQSQSVFARNSSKWSIPCCSHISLGKGGGEIRLPGDSDNDSNDEDYSQPNFSSSLFHTHNEDDRNDNLPSVFLQTEGGSQASLSRNPFASVSSNKGNQSVPSNRQIFATEEHRIDSFTPKVSGEEELANFTRSSFTRYGNEPDWTEPYRDNEDVEDSTKSIADGCYVSNNEEYGDENDGNNKDDDTKSDLSEDALITQKNPVLNDHNKNTNNITISKDSKEQGEEIPQIEEEILHMPPLSEISSEMPSALIYKKSSFEKSMYGEEPLMSAQKIPEDSRVSRFSMTEEDYLALKRQKEQGKRTSSFNATETSAETSEIDHVQLREGNPLSTLNSDPQEQKIKAKPLAAVTDDKRTSIAQSILGDRLDDFTEKLAFIKKNIIMSIDSDDEGDEEEGEVGAEKMLKKMEEAKSGSTTSKTSTQKPLPILHRRTSSFMDAVPTLARFMNQIGGSSMATDASTSSNAQSSLLPTPFSPSSLFSALAEPMQEPSSSPTSNRNLISKRLIPEEEEKVHQEDEELFDFTKVLEIGKNVKNFGEGVVGNGIRMFNDVATRVKTTVQEEQKRAAQIAPQRTESSSTVSSINNENEWMHNYL